MRPPKRQNAGPESGVEVTTKFFPLAFLFYLCTPRIQIGEDVYVRGWGAHFFPLPPGRHTIKAHNTLFGDTVEFDAAAGETVRYRCENGLTPGGIVMVLFMGVAYLRVRLKRL